MIETVTGIAESEARLAAAEEKLREAQAELSNPDIELEDMKILKGATFSEKNQAFSDLMAKVNEARDEHNLRSQVISENQLIEQRRRNAQMGRQVYEDAAAGTPPEQREAKMAKLTAPQFQTPGRGGSVAGVTDAMLGMPVMNEFMGNWLEASAGNFANFRGEVQLGEQYAKYVYPSGSWAYGIPLNDLTAQLATITTGDGSGGTPTTSEGTKPTIMMTTLPNPYMSVINLVNTMNVPTVDANWWIENTRHDLTSDEFSLNENTLPHEIDITGQLYPISTRRHAVTSTQSKQALNNGIQMQSIIMDRLPTLGRRALDQELVIGDGTAPNLRGIVNWSGFATTVPDPTVRQHSVAATTHSSADDMTEAEIRALRRTIFRGSTDITRLTGGVAAPNAMVFDWNVYDLLLTATDDNGRPLTAENFSVGIPPNILGMPVLPTSWMTMGADGTNFGILADWSRAVLQVQASLDGGGVIISTENEDNIKRGVVTFVHERQVGFVLEMPQAFVILQRS